MPTLKPRFIDDDIETANLTSNTQHERRLTRILQKLLVNEVALFAKTRDACNAVEGHDYYYIHKYFEEQCTQLEEIIKELAQRIRLLDHDAPTNLLENRELTHLSEIERQNNDQRAIMKGLLRDHESIIVSMGDHIPAIEMERGDSGMRDFIVRIKKLHEKRALNLRWHFL